MRQMRGRAVMPPDVQALYTRWLEKHERQLEGASKAGELSAFWSRLSIMTLKFAMLLQASHNQQLTISKDVMERSIALTEFLKASLTHLFEEEFAFSKDMQDRQRILRLVTNRPGITFRDLLRASSLLKKQLQPITETLIAEGRIEIRDHQGYWPSDVSEPVSKVIADIIRPRFSVVS